MLLQTAISAENEVLSPISVIITDSAFDNNEGLYGTAGILSGVRNFTLLRANITTNSALSTSAGFVFTPLSDANSHFLVQNCTFRNNSAMSHGVIAILDTRGDITESQYTLDWQVKDSSFQANSAQSLGAAISSSGFLFFSPQSSIRNSRFEGNSCADQGSSLRLEYSTGIVQVVSSFFVGNTGQTGAVVYSEHHGLSATPTYLRLERCVFRGNKGQSLVMVSDVMKPRLVMSYAVFEGNEGTCVHVDMGFWEDSNAVYRGNTAKQGAVVILTNSATGKLTYAVASGNRATVKGGVAVISMYSNLTMQSSTLTDNFSGNMAGAVYVDQLSSLRTVDVLFRGNTCAGKGSAIASFASAVVLIRSQFEENVSGNLGCIVLTESNFTMRGSGLSGNRAGIRAPGIIAMSSFLNISGSTFRNQSAPDMGAFLYVRDMSVAEVTGCVFAEGSAEQGGAIFLGLRSQMTVKDSDFRLCSGEQYAGVMTCRICSLTLTNVTVESNLAPRNAALLLFNQGNVTISHSRFHNYSGSALSVEASTNLLVSQVNFSGGVATYGAAVKAIDSIVAIESCWFAMNLAKLGGCVYAQVTGNSATQWRVNITDSVFEHCSAVNGGAVYTDGFALNMQGNEFYSNLALAANYQSVELIQRNRGGAVYFVCSLHSSCSFSLLSNLFVNNSAGEQGGALFWADNYPLLSENSFENNTAEYGPEIASYPVRLASISPNGTLSAYFHTQAAEPVIDQYAGLGSGQVFAGVIRVALVDHYGNVVVADSSSAAVLKSTDLNQVAAVGSVQALAKKGVFEFRNVSFLGLPDTLQRIQVYSAAINPHLKVLNNDPNAYYPSVTIELRFRNCTLGETLQSLTCYVCPGGTYSLNPDLPCKTCPLHAVCLGNWTMVPDPGYWRPDELFETFFPCPNADSCLGSPDPRKPSLTGECSAGYTGNLCSVCESGYSRQGSNQCNKCPNTTSNVILSLLVGIGGILLLIIAVAISIRGATRPRSEFAIYVKIFTNYIQMVVVAASLNMNWPGFVSLFLNGQETVGSVTDQLFSFECLGQEFFTMEGIFYKKIIGYVVLPVLLLLLAVVLWGFVKLVTKMKAIPHKVVTSMVIIVFVLHPSLTKITFSIFSCSELLPHQYWLITDMSIRCWDLPHLKNILSIALPSVIVWIFGLPLLCLGLLYRTRQRLSAELIQIKYSFLYKGYKPEYYYWEFVILYRKVALVCASVFLSSVSTMVQALSILAILLICLFVHAAVKPFRTPVFNLLETKSILVSLLTIYIGLYFQANNWRIEINILLFIVILLANIYFLVSWIRKIVPIIVSTIVRTFRRNRENLPVQLPGLQGADNSDLSNSKDSVLRAGDSRVGGDRSAGLDIPPPNTTHGVYTLGLLDRPEDMRGKGELDYQFPDDITPGDSQQDHIYGSGDEISPASPPFEPPCVIEEEKQPDPQLDETVDIEKSPIQPADKSA